MMPLNGEHPRDPRSRAVIVILDKGKGAVEVRLECGHVTLRRPRCCPSRVICHQC